MNTRRLAMATPVMVACGVVAWRALPSGMQADVIRSSRRIAAGVAAKIAFSLWRDTDIAPPDLEDLGAAGFDWRSHTDEPAEFQADLEASGVWAHEAGPLSDGHDVVVMEKLQEAGIHLDQEGTPGLPRAASAARYVGTTTPLRLVDALSAALSKGRAGMIVDTNGSVVEIDQHPSVGAGLLVLIDESGAHLLRSGTNRALLQAIRQSSGRLGMATGASEQQQRSEDIARAPGERY